MVAVQQVIQPVLIYHSLCFRFTQVHHICHQSLETFLKSMSLKQLQVEDLEVEQLDPEGLKIPSLVHVLRIENA